MRAGFIGCVESSRKSLETLLNVEGLDLIAVVTRENSAVNADFCSLVDLCESNNIDYFLENPKFREKSVDFFRKYDLDIVFCIGWSYLLSSNMLTLPKQGVVGYHPASLPSNRGRHPIIWALALGLEETASTFFKMDEGADSGPIASQVTIPIEPKDNATSLYQKVLNTSQLQLAQLAVELVSGRAEFKEQDHTKASYLRKRSRKDGLIDFRMTANSIHNLIRALAPPYPGAEVLFKDDFRVVKESVVDSGIYPRNIEPGKILELRERSILVKAADLEAIWLNGIDTRGMSVGEFL